jgi:hypothetical protein
MRLFKAFHSNAVWPPGFLIAWFIVIYAGFNGAVWLVDIMTGYRTEALPEITNLRKVLLESAAVTYAFFRLGRFHPACNRAYAVWLRLTPWNAGKPLPLGPIHPVWQDACVIAVIAAIARWHARVDPLIPLAAFGFGYLGAMTLIMAIMRRWGTLVILGFLWPTLFLPAFQGWWTWTIVLAITVAACLGHRTGLKAFPWPWVPEKGPVATSVLQMNVSIPTLNNQVRTAHEGWPLVSLSPKFRCPSFPFRTALAVSTLIGWWLYCAFVYAKDSWPPEMLVFLALWFSFFRLILYCGGVAAPINLFGRIASGRLLIPRHDKVFVTPLAALLVAILGAILLRRTGSISAATIAGLAALILFVLFAGGPVMRTWLLTGAHRFQPPSRHFTTKAALKPV